MPPQQTPEFEPNPLDASHQSGAALFLTAVGLLIAATLIRTYELGASPLWLDEAYSVQVAKLGVGEILAKLRLDLHPPAFFLVLHSWMATFGNSEGSARFISALAGAFLPLCVFLGIHATRSHSPALPRDTIGEYLGSLAPATMLVLSPLALHYSQECRMYSLASLLGVGCLIATIRAGDSPYSHARTALLFVIATALMYTHNYGMFIVLGCAAYGLVQMVSPHSRRGGLPIVAALAAALLAFAPWALVMASQADSGGARWIQDTWASTNPALVLPTSFAVNTIAPQYPFYLVKLSNLSMILGRPLSAHILGWIGLIISVGFLVIGSYRVIRDPNERLGRLALTAIGFAWVLPFLVSAIARPIYVIGRYDVIAIGPLFIVMGAGIRCSWNAGPSRMIRAMVISAVLAWLLIAGSFAYASSRFGIDSREKSIAEWYKENASEGDVVIVPGLPIVVTAYYWERLGCRVGLLPFPVAAGYSPGWLDQDGLISNQAQVGAALDTLMTLVGGGTRPDGIVYLTCMADVSTPLCGPLLGRLESRFGTGERLAASGTIDGVELWAFGRSGAPRTHHTRP